MEIIRDQLSIAAQAGALDGSLAFTTIYNQHRDLIAQTAASGLRGLQDILSETGLYGQAVRSLQEAASHVAEANALAAADPFVLGGAGYATGAVDGGRHAQSSALSPGISSAQSSATTAVNATADKTPERTEGNAVLAAANGVANANAAFYNGDPSRVQAAYDAASAERTNAQKVLDDAVTALGKTPVTPADARAAAQKHVDDATRVRDAANQTFNAAQSLLNLRNTPIGQLAGVSPTTSDLGNGYQLSTWGSTGLATITDSSGHGVVISPNGSVDPLDGIGKGWQFNTTSTFVLPGDTKVTFNPGNPADVLVSRGLHAFTLNNLKAGQGAITSDYESLNGRVADRASNDGYVMDMGSDAAHWMLGSSVLGDAGSREVVAVSAISNERKLDPTDVAISPEMKAFMDQAGITSHDYDGDGKLNNDELGAVASEISSYITTLQDQYEAALAKLAKANEALNDLNDLLEVLRKQNDKQLEGHAADAASAKSELEAVERKLLSALESLQGSNASASSPLSGGIENNATVVLQQLTTITQQGGVQPQPPSTSGPTATGQATGAETTIGQPATDAGSDPLGASLRRAGRLLSGLLGGGNLNILDLPPNAEGTANTAGPTAPATGAVDGGQLPFATVFQTLEALGSSLASLVTSLSEQAGLPQAGAQQLAGVESGVQGLDVGSQVSGLETLGVAGKGSPAAAANLGAGLQGMLTGLESIGLVDPSALQQTTSIQDLLQILEQAAGLTSTASSTLLGINTSQTSGTNSPQDGTTLLETGGVPSFSLSSSPPRSVAQPGSAPQPPVSALLTFLGNIEQLGAMLKAAGSQTTPGQLDKPSTASLASLSVTAQQVADILAGKAMIGSAGAEQGSGSTTHADGSPATLSRTAEQLKLVLQGLAALGSAGAGQSTNNTGAQLPSNAEIGLGLQSFLAALVGLGLFASNNQQAPVPSDSSSTSTSTSGVSFQSANTQAISTITGNFATDPELLKIIEANLSNALKVQTQQLNRASNLFVQSQEIVQKFVDIVKHDDLVHDVVKSDKLSDEEQALFDERMKGLRKDWGIDWGGPEDNHTPTSQSNLVSRAVQSGLMV